tara:strand:- start:663 stop:968 length:306 start_codon:yes stop_codon:yes gene_type:complete
MLKVRLGGTADFKALERSVEKLLNEVADKTKSVAQANTPKRSGYARKNWTKKKDDDGFSVANRTPYIQYLEKGTSKQAPQGITKPTVRKITGFIGTRRLKR